MVLKFIPEFFILIFHCFIGFLIVAMLVDTRSKHSNSPVKIPPKYKAYVYKWCDLGDPLLKVVIAESQVHADQYIHDWCFREDITNDAFFYFLGCVDYEVPGIANDEYYMNLMFPDHVSKTDTY